MLLSQVHFNDGTGNDFIPQCRRPVTLTSLRARRLRPKEGGAIRNGQGRSRGFRMGVELLDLDFCSCVAFHVFCFLEKLYSIKVLLTDSQLASFLPARAFI